MPPPPAPSDDTPELRETGFVPAFADAPYGAVLGSVAAAMSAVGTAAIGALMVLIVADVVGRNFLNMPITGVSEIAARTVVAIVFLQVPAAILQCRLTRADFLIRRIERLSPRAVALMESLFCLAAAIVFALVLWASWPKLLSSWQSAEFFGVQGVWTIVTWPFRAITVGGATIAVLAALYRASVELRRIGAPA
ncbi:TRAP transporter - DctQ subunit (plasmid) [Dinoroseobacter shibae DFL 12 = DSM 16493]|jgi:TRAP-type C4-dicarboxylate transport system permease small subunit|uniref:TRAP transporter small permease protein n=1 Tax=Dinoroseobacter shibae (strain DSM 16493 / NCIMB 14021 / DFL 12) TaxID=398580 RepID=A8LUJ7_DINSH|nr:TRAP transporter small permease [Dinoroseobacter shibae]ABV95914.1 TRAP transporter - DctQ subunit [Dinoroseobacter shibae DFL 12 = DSM 16493]URF49156.1 TRAP transporter small permease [Dinoroseobacter shibae]URF53464.1 TRAP transporter small permease [Dinoroseobacter shibae]